MKTFSLLFLSVALSIFCATSLIAQKQVATKVGFGFSNGIWDSKPINVQTYSSFSMNAGAVLRLDIKNYRFEFGTAYLAENNEVNYGSKPIETIDFTRSSLIIPVSAGYKIFPNAAVNLGASIQMIMQEDLAYPDDYEIIYTQNEDLALSPFVSFHLGLTDRLEFNVQYNQSVNKSMDLGLANTEGVLKNYSFYRSYFHVGMQFNLFSF